MNAALEQALFYWERRSNLTQNQKKDAAVALSDYRLFSIRQIAAVLEMSWPQVAGVVKPKSDKTGGRFDPATLPALVELARLRERNEVNVFTAHAALQGTSVYLAERLTGVPKTSLARWSAQAAELMAP